jgi:four helix bundle protein
MRRNILKEKSFALAIRISKLYQFLRKEHTEYVLLKQVLRSGTSIGPSIRESINAASKKDFIYKLTISLKETEETVYWLELLYHTNFLEEKLYLSLVEDCNEIIKLLTASLKTAKQVVT